MCRKLRKTKSFGQLWTGIEGSKPSGFGAWIFMKLEQFSPEDGLPNEWSEGKEERVEAGGRMGKWGLQAMHECFVCLFFFFLAGWFFLCTPRLKSFLLLFFLNPYFDLFYSVIRLNFPHPLPQSSIPWVVIPLQRRCHLPCSQPLRFHLCYSPK